MLPVASIARTWNTRFPRFTFFMRSGDVHAANGFASIRHSNVAPASLDENSNRTFRLRDLARGPTSMPVSGAVTSSVVVVTDPKTVVVVVVVGGEALTSSRRSIMPGGPKE